jgi:hypothetical protein
VTPPPSSWAWLKLTGPPIMVAIKSNKANPVAIGSIFIAGTPSFSGFIEFSPFFLRDD